MNLIIIKGLSDWIKGDQSLVKDTQKELVDKGYNCSSVWEPVGSNQHIFMVTLRPYQTFDLDTLSDGLTAYRIEDDESLELALIADCKFRDEER